MMNTLEAPRSSATAQTEVGGQAPPAPRLTIQSGPNAGRAFAVDRDRLVIGRVTTTGAFDVTLDDQTVSRPHAQLVRDGETFVLHDLGSANGTSLNYRRLTAPKAVDDGDLIQVGRTVLVFRTPAGLAEPPQQVLPGVQCGDSHVLTYFRLKGGVGATTLAVNTALRLQQLAPEPVLLVDLSVEQPGIAVHLDLPVRRGLDTIARLPAPAPELLGEVIIRHETGLDLLVASTAAETAELITGELLAQVLPALRPHYRWIVVDTTPTFSDLNLSALDQTDVLLVVTTPDVATVKTTQACLAVCDSALRTSCERRVILNHVYPRFQLELADVVEMLRDRIDFTVPYSEDVLRSIDRGLPLALSAADNPVIQAIDRLVCQTADIDAPTINIAPRGGFWARPKGLLRR